MSFGKRAWAALLLFTCSCGSPKQASVDDLAREYVQLAIALGQLDPKSLDYSYGPAASTTEVRSKPPTNEEIATRANALATRLQTFPPSPRVEFLRSQLPALVLRTKMLRGQTLPFDQEAAILFGVRAPQVIDEAALGHARAELNMLLPGPGPLAERLSSFEARYVVKPDRAPAVWSRALAACRAVTRATLTLPEGESIALSFVTDKPWNAYSYYLGNAQSRIEINADFPLTVDRVLDLACHEGYPGHHTFNLLRDRARQNRVEWTVQPTFSPQSFESEAAAAIAPEIAFPGEERTHLLRQQLFPAAGIDPSLAAHYTRVMRLVDQLGIVQARIGRDFLEGRLEWLRAEAALADEAAMAHAEPTLKYLNVYRTYLLTYTTGKAMAKRCLDARRGGWALLRDLSESRISLLQCAQ